MTTRVSSFIALFAVSGLLAACAPGLEVGLPSVRPWVRAVHVTPVGPSPEARDEHTAIYDAASARMTVLGGDDGSAVLNDVWVLTNANALGGTPTWIEVTTTGRAPRPRKSHTAVYDPGSNRMTVFGGHETGEANVFDDVWVLTNANGIGGRPRWIKLSPRGTRPDRRTEHTAGYDPGSNRMIVFGGTDLRGLLLNDVWILTNAGGTGGTPRWIELSPDGTAPPGLRSHTAVYDPGSNRMTVFGGFDATTRLVNEIWVLTNANGTGGTPTWVQLSPTGGAPERRHLHTAVYDPGSNHMTVFGGFDGSDATNDVWVLTNANGTGGAASWILLTPAGTPPGARNAHSAIYDPRSNRMTVFGGLHRTTGSELGDIWVLTGANGEQRP